MLVARLTAVAVLAYRSELTSATRAAPAWPNGVADLGGTLNPPVAELEAQRAQGPCLIVPAGTNESKPQQALDSSAPDLSKR